MRVASVACELPKQVVTNQDIVNIIEQKSRPGFKGDLDRTLKLINTLLRKSGLRERRMLTLDEKPFDYIYRAVHCALDNAQMSISDVDMVIHASIDRRVAEPGMSFFLANALGMHSAQCFDVLEACASWTRAVSIAQGYLMSGMVRKVLVITAEFGMHEGEWGQNPFKFDSIEDLEYNYSNCTLGESTTATILTADDAPWQFENATANNYADLCMMPLGITRPEMMQYGDVSMMGRGELKFACQASKMAEAGMPLAQKVFTERYKDQMKDIDLVIPHSHTYNSWIDQAAINDMDVPYYFIWPKTGNLITGSIPAAMSMAIADGSLKRGDRVAAWMAAAGLSFTSFDFTY